MPCPLPRLFPQLSSGCSCTSLSVTRTHELCRPLQCHPPALHRAPPSSKSVRKCLLPSGPFPAPPPKPAPTRHPPPQDCLHDWGTMFENDLEFQMVTAEHQTQSGPFCVCGGGPHVTTQVAHPRSLVLPLPRSPVHPAGISATHQGAPTPFANLPRLSPHPKHWLPMTCYPFH